MSDQKPIADQPGDEHPSQAEISQPDGWAQVQLSSHPSARRGAAAPPTFAPGDLLANRFRLIRYIGKGGMGEVFEAEDLELHGEHVAIKTVLPAIAADPEMIAQFKREIQLSRRVTHPNVCRIFDLVYDQRPSGAIAFLTMELLDGEPLSTFIRKKGALSAEQVVPLARQMAEGLDAAHKVGVVHQDFKPGNVMISPAKDGEGYHAVITDFGLAHNLRETERRAGKSAGTPAYMAPEQIEGKSITPATDVYALGVVLYELFTQHWPYTGGTPEELQRKKLEEVPVLPTMYAPKLSPVIERVLLRCLAKRPEERFQSTLEVAKALAPRQTLRRNLMIGAALLILVAAAAGYQWRRMAAARVPAIGVIGFKNDSGNADYDWLATELSETLTAELAGSQQIHVVPAEDVARLKVEMSLPSNESLAKEDPAQVRAALGATYLVSGSYTVPGPGGALNVHARLQSPQTDQGTDFQVSGQQQDYRPLISELAAKVRKSVGANAPISPDSAETQNIYPSDADARKLYFQALDKLRVFDAPAAAELLQQAAAKDNSNVAIHSALADAWSQLRRDPQAAAEAQVAATLAQQNSESLPLEYVVLTSARAEEMNKQWNEAARDYATLWNKYRRLNYGLRLAAVQTESGETSAALKTLGLLKALPAPMTSDPRIEMGYAKTYAAMSNSTEQIKAATAALAEAQQRNSRMMQADAQLQLCWAYRNQDVDKASAACNDAYQLFNYIGDKVSAAVTRNDLATLLVDKGRYPEARKIYDEVIATNKAAGAMKDYAGANVNAAKTAILMEKPDDALEYLGNALSAAREANDKYDEGRARIMRADILAAGGKTAEAESEVQQALAAAKASQDTALQASALTALADYQQEKNTAQALQNYGEALRLRERNQDKPGIATSLNNIAEVLFRTGDLNGAAERYRQSLEQFDKLGARNAAARNVLSLAEVAFERKDMSAAESQALQAMKEFQNPDRQDPDSEEAAAALLIKIYIAEGKLQRAEPYVQRIRKNPSSDPEVMFNSRLSIAEYLAANGNSKEAEEQLRSVAAQAEAAGRHFAALEARLQLAYLLGKNGQSSQADRELQAVRKAARQMGFDLLVTKTQTAAKHAGPLALLPRFSRDSYAYAVVRWS
jgi:tetratricopeptide (TPR) repeat protein/TolB-like protein